MLVFLEISNYSFNVINVDFPFSFARITKEVRYYEKEVEKEKQRLVKMQNEGKDEYNLKYQVNNIFA